MSSQRDYKELMDLDISRNNIGETSLKYLADVIRKFQGFKSLNMQSLPRMRTDAGWIDFCRALRDSHTL